MAIKVYEIRRSGFKRKKIEQLVKCHRYQIITNNKKLLKGK